MNNKVLTSIAFLHLGVLQFFTFYQFPVGFSLLPHSSSNLANTNSRNLSKLNMQTSFYRIIFQNSDATWIDATLFMIYRQFNIKTLRLESNSAPLHRLVCVMLQKIVIYGELHYHKCATRKFICMTPTNNFNGKSIQTRKVCYLFTKIYFKCITVNLFVMLSRNIVWQNSKYEIDDLARYLQ